MRQESYHILRAFHCTINYGLGCCRAQKPICHWAAIIDTDLADVSKWDEDGALVFKTFGELTAEQKVAVSEIAQERGRDAVRTLKIGLYDKLAAKGHLAKLLNMLVDRQEISRPSGGPVEVTDHRARITERLNAISKRQAPDDDGASGNA